MHSWFSVSLTHDVSYLKTVHLFYRQEKRRCTYSQTWNQIRPCQVEISTAANSLTRNTSTCWTLYATVTLRIRWSAVSRIKSGNLDSALILIHKRLCPAFMAYISWYLFKSWGAFFPCCIWGLKSSEGPFHCLMVDYINDFLKCKHWCTYASERFYKEWMKLNVSYWSVVWYFALPFYSC